MKKYIFCIIAGMATWGCGNSNPEQSSTDKAPSANSEVRKSSNEEVLIPKLAKDFVKEHFTTAVKNSREKKSPSSSGTFFEVNLMDGIEIDFDAQGNWIEVDAAKDGVIPHSFLPSSIQEYLKTNFNGVGLKNADKTIQGFELELTNDLDLYFDEAGMFIRQEK